MKISTNKLEGAIDLHMQDENILKKSRKKLQKAQKVAKLGFLDWDLKTNKIHWSDEIYNIFGINRTEEMQTIDTTTALVHPDDLDFAKKNLDEAINGTKEYNIEHRMLRPDGGVVWVHSRAELERDRDGNPESLLGTVMDITERKNIEKELEHSKKDLEKLAGRLISNQEKELSRLARELHDGLTQDLAVTAIEAGSIEKAFKDLPGPVLQKIAGVKDKLIKMSKEVHYMSRDIHPSIIEDLGLTRAVQSECSNFSSRMGIAVIFKHKSVPENTSAEIALALYRIIQEGLSNIAKHAKTKNAYVFLEGVDDSIMLTIRDTGTGFDMLKEKYKAALGLGSMRERTRLVNGSFKVRSKIGKGTTVDVMVPLKEEYK